jgi:Acetyltransferase (GNAT) domain
MANLGALTSIRREPRPWAEGPSERMLSTDIIAHAEWDALLDLFEDVNYEQTSLFTSRIWGKENTVCVIVTEDGEPIGGMCYGRARVPLLGGVGFCKVGPVWRLAGRPGDLDRYNRLVAALCRHAKDAGLALTLIPRAHPIFTALESDALKDLGLKQRCLVRADHFICNATLSPDQQMANFAQTWRANLRKAEKADLEIVELQPGDYAAFEKLYDEMSRRKQVLMFRPVDVVPQLAETLPENLKPKCLMAYHEGEAVAGIVYGVLGDTAYYLYGASNGKALPVRAGYKLQWEVLERIRGHANWYDLGTSSDEPGLAQFKSGLIGKEGLMLEVPGEFDFASGLKAKLALKLVYGARGARRILRSWKSRLYRG